jgi:hypothetical protein
MVATSLSAEGAVAMTSRNRGKPKPKLRDLSRAKLTTEEQSLLSGEFFSAPPISAAILGAVMVEHELDACLRRRFTRISDEDWGEMLEDNGPLRSLHSKIILGHALHIYGDATRDNLNILRSIRNAFAHSKKLINFDHELIAAELRKIKKGPFGKRAYTNMISGKSKPSTVFVILCYTLAGELLRKQRTAMKAQTARIRKKRQVPFLNLLSGAMGSPYREESIKGHQLLSLANQTGDPNRATPRGLLDGLSQYFDPSHKRKKVTSGVLWSQRFCPHSAASLAPALFRGFPAAFRSTGSRNFPV